MTPREQCHKYIQRNRDASEITEQYRLQSHKSIWTLAIFVVDLKIDYVQY